MYPSNAHLYKKTSVDDMNKAASSPSQTNEETAPKQEQKQDKPATPNPTVLYRPGGHWRT